jgi:hypothetical protein
VDEADEVTLLYTAFGSFSATSLVIAIDSVAGSRKTMKGAGDFFRETSQEAGTGAGPKALSSTVL